MPYILGVAAILILALGRARMPVPWLLLLDEPSEGIQPSIVQEIGEILVKLERLKLVYRKGNRYVAAPIDAALKQLDYVWDRQFCYDNAEAAA